MSKNNKIWLSPPHLSGEEQKYIQQAFTKNWIATEGENITEFENDLEFFLGKNIKATALISGTSSIHLALILAGVKAGDEVICQSFTFVASVNPVLYLGATPIFIDSENDTWNMCPVLLEQAIQDRIKSGKKPKCIIVVHLYGMPAKISEIVKIAKKYDIKLIEDAAEALGSSYDGQMCGTFGNYGILSFNGNKIITTSSGGALLCKSYIEKRKAVFLATQAKDVADYYQHSEVGYNYRMNNISAGIGRGQMEVLDKRIKERIKTNQFYKKEFLKYKGIQVLNEPNQKFKSNYWLSCIIIDKKSAKKTAHEMYCHLKLNKIDARLLWKPMHLQPVFSKHKFYGTKISQTLFENGLCLPSGSNLTIDEKQRIMSTIASGLK